MKKTITLILILLAVSLQAKSGIKFDKYIHDFGDVPQSVIVVAKFTFRNTGNSVLVIERIRTSCGCTSTMLSKKELNPGESGILEISFDTEGYSGSITRAITVYTNSPARKEVKLKIKANVTEVGDK